MKYDSDEVLAFHRNPAYWDGYVLGETGPDAIPSTESRRIPHILNDFSNNCRARQALHGHLETARIYYPDQTIHSGEIFDPNGFDPLTIIAMTKESIQVLKNAKRPLKQCSYPDDLPRDMPPHVTPNLGRRSALASHIATPSFRYILSGEWGVVTQGKHGHQITNISDQFVSYEGKARVAPLFFSHDTPRVIPVGKVLGELYRCSHPEPDEPRPSVDFFMRYNQIDILGVSSSGYKKKTRSFLSRLVIGELPT